MGQMAGGHTYNNMPIGRGMTNSSYMYGPGAPNNPSGIMGMPGQYGGFSNHIGSSSGPNPGQNLAGSSLGGSNQNLAMGGPNQSLPSPGSGSSSVTPPSGMNSANLPGQTVPASGSGVKGAQAAAQAAMIAAANSATVRPPHVRAPLANPPRMFGPQTVSPMGQMNHMGYNSNLTNLANSVNQIPNSSSPVPPPMLGHLPNSGMPGGASTTTEHSLPASLPASSSIPAEMPLSAQSSRLPPSTDQSAMSSLPATSEHSEPDTTPSTTTESEEKNSTAIDSTSISSPVTSAHTTPAPLTNSLLGHASPPSSSTPSMQETDSTSNTVPLSSVPECVSNTNSNASTDVIVTEPSVLSNSNVPNTAMASHPSAGSPSSASCSSIVSSATDIVTSESQLMAQPLNVQENNSEGSVQQAVDNSGPPDLSPQTMKTESQQPCNNLSSANEETYPITTTANCTGKYS